MFNGGGGNFNSSAPFDLNSRVLTFFQTVNPDFLGLNNVNVATSNSMPLQKCQRITQTFPAPLGRGWYSCTFEHDVDGTDLIQAAWAYDINHTNGVTVYDVVLIRQVANSTSGLFVNSYANIAADVIVDGNILHNDADEVQRLILGYIPKFSQVPSWRFVPAGLLLLNPSFFAQFEPNPFLTFPPYPGYLGQYNRLLSVPSDYDPQHLGIVGGSVGVKMGDVNFSNADGFPFAPDPMDRSEQSIAASPKYLKKGTVIQITCSAKDSLPAIVAAQAAYRFDKEKVNIWGVNAEDLPGFGKDNYNILDETQEIRTLWVQPQTKAVQLKEGTKIFSLILELQREVPERETLLNFNEGMETAFYRLDGSSIANNLAYKVTIIEEPLSVSTMPNPFHDQLRIKAIGGMANTPTIFILVDLSGREIDRHILDSGQTETPIQTASLPNGVYFLKTVNDKQSSIIPVIKQ